MVDALSSFKHIDTIIINWLPDWEVYGSEADLNRYIEAIKEKLKDLAPSKERRYIRICLWHKSNDRDFHLGYLASGRVSRRDKLETDINTDICQCTRLHALEKSWDGYR
jgi:hypothetical protein